MPRMKRPKHLFILAPGIVNASTAEEVEATVAGLKEAGLYQMPYDRDVFVQISALETVGPDADPDHQIVYGPIGENQLSEMHVLHAKSGKTVDIGTCDEPCENDLRNLLIVLLATKNAEKDTTENKLARLGIGKSFKNRFAYTTTISLPSALPSDPDNPASGGHVCPHLRRGHVRRQHHGPGNAEIKTIWIAPVFVNADPEFVQTRKAYRIAA